MTVYNRAPNGKKKNLNLYTTIRGDGRLLFIICIRVRKKCTLNLGRVTRVYYKYVSTTNNNYI